MSRAALRARWQRLSRACSVTAADEALIARSASTLPMPHSAPLPSFGRILQRAGRGEPRQNPAHSNPPRRAGIWLLPSPAAVALPPGSHHQRVRPFRSLKSDQAVSSYRPADPQVRHQASLSLAPRLLRRPQLCFPSLRFLPLSHPSTQCAYPP